MKQRHIWLLALLSILTLMTTATLAIAEEGKFSGHVEIGISGIETDDNPARVNEYVTSGAEKGFNFAPSLSLETVDNGSAFAIDADIMGPRDQQFNLEADVKRILQLRLDYQVLEHWKDHETLDQMGATARDDVGGGQPSVTTDKTMAELAEMPTPVTSVGGGTLNYDPRTAYEQELTNDYIVTRRELESDVDLTIPALPNITFHTGMRVETRQGMEQAIGVTKCDSCHVSASGKNIDERTEDFTFGATGKFGHLTVDYEYLNRTFSEDSAAPQRYYEDAGNPTAYNLLYEAGDYEYARTPDSEKDSHALKARVDLPNNTSVTGSYVKSDIESSKAETQGEYALLGGDTLKTEYESLGAKLSTKFGDNLRLSLRGSMADIENDSNEIYFPAREVANAATAWPGTASDAYQSAEARETKDIGIDLVYRLAKGTTLRLGYEYETVEREEAALGDTITQTLKAALKTRINKTLSGRISYQYQDIDEPFAGAHVGIAQGVAVQDTLDPALWYYNTADFTAAATVPTWYWTAAYPNRTLASSNQPESVHEAKFNTTWAPVANLAATLSARVRFEENESVDYQQETYVPGVSIWYAPNSKINLTMAYTFNKQETENKMCVGWYHG